MEMVVQFYYESILKRLGKENRFYFEMFTLVQKAVKPGLVKPGSLADDDASKYNTNQKNDHFLSF